MVDFTLDNIMENLDDSFWRDNLITQITHTGFNPEYHLFWGGPFSQWYDSLFMDGNTSYCHCEQYMMAHKAMTFNDDESLAAIMATKSPREAKALGRKVVNYDQETWDKVKFDIVVNANRLKFMQSLNLQKYLLDTGDDILVEASPYDRIWGIGMGS